MCGVLAVIAAKSACRAKRVDLPRSHARACPSLRLHEVEQLLHPCAEDDDLGDGPARPRRAGGDDAPVVVERGLRTDAADEADALHAFTPSMGEGACSPTGERPATRASGVRAHVAPSLGSARPTDRGAKMWSPLDSSGGSLKKEMKVRTLGGELVSTEDGRRLVRAVVGQQAT
jgi:hypothetical protein